MLEPGEDGLDGSGRQGHSLWMHWLGKGRAAWLGAQFCRSPGSGGKTPKVDRETVGLQRLKQSSEAGGSGAFVLTKLTQPEAPWEGSPEPFP